MDDFLELAEAAVEDLDLDGMLVSPGVTSAAYPGAGTVMSRLLPSKQARACHAEAITVH